MTTSYTSKTLKARRGNMGMLCCRSCPSLPRCETVDLSANLQGQYCKDYKGTMATWRAEAALRILEMTAGNPVVQIHIDAFLAAQWRDYEIALAEHKKRRAGQELPVSPDRVKP